MPTGKLHGSLDSITGLSLQLPDGLQRKTLPPRNPKLTRDEETILLTPSAFLMEMSLTTEQKLARTRDMHPPKILRLLDMSETSHQKFSMVNVDQALFQPFPSGIVFQNYVACETYEVPLSLRNNDRVPRLVKVTQEASPYFKIVSPSDVGHKVAPGMQSIFHILFTPEENKDYFHELTCITEREMFVVPIRAIGARAILDFPDELNFSTCPVKYNSQKTLLIRNIGKREARFELDVPSPFSVEPSVGTLAIAESMQVTVAFQAQQIGDHSEDLVVHYDTGEDIYVRLYGAASDINVRLDKNSLMVEKTYLSMANQRTVTISNRSDIIAHFQWKTWATQEEEDQHKLRFYTSLQTEEEEETNRFLAECGADPMMRERLSILSRTFHNRKKTVQRDAMLFTDNIFIVEPVEGDVWPNSSVDVNVIFKPQEAKVYQCTIYCDITGRETRLPLRIKGEGMGPQLRFNFDQLDIGKVFVNSLHSYEVILTNKGSIDAIFTLLPPSTALGSSFTFDPNEGIVLPGGHQAIQISFSTSILGEFNEEFKFEIDGSPVSISFTICGCVIGPTFHFSVPALNFGDVSFGFPCTLKVSLHNTSLVPLTFNLRVPMDGTGEPSVTSCDQILEKERAAWMMEYQGDAKATEFSITPSSGTIRPQGDLNIQVTLCANHVKKYELALVVDVEGVFDEVLALPITASCTVPSLRLETPALRFGRCFLQYPYQQTVTLVNDGDLPGCYGVLPQEPLENPLVLYSSPIPRGIIEPHSTAEIPLVVEAQVTGELNIKAHIAVFGQKEPLLEVCMMCTGEGPVVHISPEEVDFGGVPVLTDVSRTLLLSNQSCIPARFLAKMVRSRSQWRIEPSEGVVPPEADVEVTLVANLDDTLKFQDKVSLAIENSNVYTIKVQATGTGTTITTDRPFAPALNLGSHFSAGPCRYHFTMMNRGRRTHQLYWMTEGFPQFRKRSNPSTTGNKSKNSSQNLEPSTRIFSLSPFRMELNPGQSIDVVLEGSTDSPKLVKERLICHAIIGKHSGKELIMSVEVTCEFIAPILHLSAKQLSFYVEKLPGQELIPKYEPLILKNISSLPLSIFLSLKEPFSVCDTENQEIQADVQPAVLDIGAERELSIKFDPIFADKLQSRVAEEVLTIQYAEHPHKDYVALRGEVHFPNLHFQTTVVDFGCILNDTEVVRHVQMTNYSPLPVHYRWSFLMDDWESFIRFTPGEPKLPFGSVLYMDLESGEEHEEAEESDVLSENIATVKPSEESKLTMEEPSQLGETAQEPTVEKSKKEFRCGPDVFTPSPELHQMHLALPQEEQHLITGVEEVFDILPLYGMLQPGESQQLSFTFFGHSGIRAQVKALCEVEGGPTYEITLRGEASLVCYELDKRELDYGLQPFDHVAETEFLLKNSGKVSFEFVVVNNIQAFKENPPPGAPLIVPSSGYIDSGGEQLMKVYYFPGVPEVFDSQFQLQIAHLEPEEIIIKGEGIFSRICLDLPRDISDKEKYQNLLKEAKENLDKELQSDDAASRPRTMTTDQLLDDSIANHDTLLQMELERLLVKEHALEQLALITASPAEDIQWSCKKLVKALLPHYVLDFGYVILGSVRTHIINITNTCPFPVSFYADRKSLSDTGFYTELDRVKNLPYCETETFVIGFDPRGANLPLGDVQVLLPIKVIGGPVFHVRLKASVTMPTLSISCEKLEFSDVQCGQCQVKYIQLHNQWPVVCEWSVSSQEQPKQVDKHVPMYLRRKVRQELKPPPQIFEMLPPFGTLVSGQKVNVQVKFMPLEEKFYSQRLVLTVSKSSQRVLLMVQGKGLEPHLDFIPSVIELGPILPYSTGAETAVVVKNPCNFPIEFYSLELDRQYLEEEQILRMIKGYDAHNILLLPPRESGEKLPKELLEYNEEQKKIQEEQAKARPIDNLNHESEIKSEDEEHHSSSEKREASSAVHARSTPSCDGCTTPKSEGKPEDGGKGHPSALKQQIIDGNIVKAVGELDNNPLSKALARHLGIDISPEGRASKNRKGIAVIVHGAPLTGKTQIAISLAKYYGAAYLSIDSVILEAIKDGSSQAGLKARELCIRAALEHAQREADEKAAQAQETVTGQPVQAGALSIEAVAKHTAEGNQLSEPKTGPQSVISKGPRGSVDRRGGRSESHVAQKQHTPDLSQTTVNVYLGPTSQRRLSVSVAGESGLMSCILPDELLVEILTERMQLSDCFQGIICDGLDTLFSFNIATALNCLLKAINNRQHIYVLNLNQEYASLKAREKARKQKEDLEEKEKLEKEKKRLKDMDEEEYDALSEEEKAMLDVQRLKVLRARKREQQERLAQELQAKKRLEELERQREEDEMKKKQARKLKKESAKEDVIGKKSHTAFKQILDSLGLGSAGPPVPPPTMFSVVHYPVERKPQSEHKVLDHFALLVASPNDPNIIVEEKEPEPEVDLPVAAPAPKEEQVTPTKSRGKIKQDQGRESQKEKRRSAGLRKSQPLIENRSPPPTITTPMSDMDRSSMLGEVVPDKLQRLNNFRWVVPPNSEISVRIHFSSQTVGQFDQTLNFEIMGTRRRYQLYCRGVCAFPSISQDPKIVFPHRRKEVKPDEIIHKKFLLNSETFDFGPLLCGKTREKYKTGRFPENMEKITIMNVSPMNAEIFFCFQHDTKATTFIMDPPTMTLKPEEKQELSLWAYPTTPGVIEDNVVCCIKENPEPTIFRISCQGVRPEVELDRKQLHFDKILLHRKDTKTIFLRNTTPLAVAWRITGLEILGDDFSVSQDQGIIAPRAEYGLMVHFKASKAVNVKKFIRLEVSDVENILGIVQIENIQIFAEAYDVALDISFPKGTDGGLDFGIVKVMDESKLSVSLKNKGKYEIAFSFSLETGTEISTLGSILSILPQKGTLAPNDRPTQVQIIFNSKKEVEIVERPVLRCQVIEPSISEGGETIASIPIKVSVRCLYTKYNIFPARDINFGALILGVRKSRTFTLENRGETEIKYSITKLMSDIHLQQPKKGQVQNVKRSRSREGSSSTKSIPLGKTKRIESSLREMSVTGQARFSLGIFTVFPGFGAILPGGSQNITVECVPDQPGKSEELLAIDISDRDPNDYPNGIPYKLLADGCIPAFVTNEIASIFEEHRICHNMHLFHCVQTSEVGGVYVEEENRFIFNNVLVGRQATARFKIINVGKVHCDVVLSVKPVSAKSTSRINEIFEVEPTRVSINNHSHIFATVTFSPQTMQTYQCVFEAALEGLGGLLSKTRNLTFEISGEGNLPRVSVMRPILRNKQGNPLLLFNRLLLSSSQKLPLVLMNEGVIPAQLHIDLLDEHGVFSVKPRPSTHCIYPAQEDQKEVVLFGKGRKAHTASLILNSGESAEFVVLFKPNVALPFKATIRLAVVDNQYEENNVQLVGEGYEDDLTLDNIHNLASVSSLENAEGQLEDDQVEATRTDHLHFGDCHVGKRYQATFTMTNRSKSDVMRFEWPADPPVRFSPQVGHLHLGCAKDIAVTLESDVPITLNKALFNCQLARISFPIPADQVPDWDDRLRTVKWVDSGRSSTTQLPIKKKVVETDPEPAHTVYDGSSRELGLHISGTIDYAQFTCRTENVQFKDTLLFQTRVYEFELANDGNVQVEFSWQVVMEGSPKMVRFSDRQSQSNPEGGSQFGGDTTSSQATSSRGMGRPESILESVSSLLSVDPDVLPFTLEPSCGTIPALKKQNILIKFSPLEVGEFESQLICSIPNLMAQQQGPVLAVKGKSIMPYCHFELEDSDYISQSRRNPDQRGPRGAPPGATLDSNTRVIEFSAVGVNTKNSRMFHIMNPTNSAYSFLWTCEDPPSLKNAPPFRCLNEKGHINPEKKAEIIFEFIPQQLGIAECFWTFTISEQNISVPFLLVGKTSEPCVTMDRSHLNFRSLLVGEMAQETVYLINNEKRGFDFTLREHSCHSEGYIHNLLVRPMEGTIPACSKFPLTILFTPQMEGDANFNLLCDVKSMSQPLNLNVKANGYLMDVSMKCEENDGSITTLSMHTVNLINFNEVEINELVRRQLHIINNGKFTFSFTCEISAPKSLLPFLEMAPETGSVESGQRTISTLTFNPTRRCTLRDSKLLIKISNGPVFSCSLQGAAVVPGLTFSFRKHDFGACFIYNAGMPPYRQTLVIKNNEKREVSLDCLYVNTAYLELDFQAEVLRSGEQMEVSITFYPRAVVKYREIVSFEINGHFRQTIEILGQGTEMKVEVADPKQRVVNFGALSAGQSLKKVVPIVNRSIAPITFSLGITPNLPVLQDPKVLSLSPSTELTLKSLGGSCKVEVTFSPKCRIPPFAEEVMLECAGMSRPLFVLRGCSQGIEVSLDMEHIPFGAVVLQTVASRRVIMNNTGDIGARFEWDVKRFQPDCLINPTQGYITPGMEVAFDVTFEPKQLSHDIRYEGIQCFIEGSKPLKLTLSGSCVGIPSTKEIVNFVCQVRGRQTQTILLTNKTNRSWTLQPIMEGEYWKGADTIIVEAHQQNKPYEVTYRPLTMTTEGKKHQGSVFFPLPDGTGLQYLLQGIAEPPKALGTIIREVPCKTSYMELLHVTNWLNKPQRVRVIVEMLKPERLDSTTTLKGLDYLDLPSASKRDYKLTFFSYKEGIFSSKIIFRNESTQEYVFYLITFKATPPGIISSIEMRTSARQSTSATVKVENPLAVPVTFTTECKVPEINLPPHFTVPAQSEGSLMFEFQPLKACEITGRLILQSAELGTFQYELILKAMSAKPEKTLYFRTPLGSNQILSAKFTNYTRQKVEYICKTDNSDFHVEKVINAAPGSQGGTEVNVEVTYEPIQLGESRAVLSISSPTGGEYTIPLIGTAVAPKPLGPIVIRAGSASSTTIPFKNVFPQTTIFSFHVDNPAFGVKHSESIRSRKVHYIPVSFEGNPSGSKAPVTGKLTISCPRATGVGQGIYWVVYLKGVTPEK
ncbi:hydrocephalus-inducing protein homolog isoform X2 [Lissotriton helveticus]